MFFSYFFSFYIILSEFIVSITVYREGNHSTMCILIVASKHRNIQIVMCTPKICCHVFQKRKEQRQRRKVQKRRIDEQVRSGRGSRGGGEGERGGGGGGWDTQTRVEPVSMWMGGNTLNNQLHENQQTSKGLKLIAL